MIFVLAALALVRDVFADHVATRGPARTRQKAMFVVSALIGLGITTAIVGTATTAGIEPHLAKLAAILAFFTTTWLLRSTIIFGGRSAGLQDRAAAGS